MSKPRVFVVQNQHKWDDTHQRFVPKFDFSSAEAFGELVYLLSPTAAPFNSAPVIRELREKLREYRDGDYLLLVGNPALILAVGAVAASYNSGRVSVLQWSGKDHRYVSVRLEGLDTSSEFTSQGH